jgi:hypothetical protein
MQLVTNIWIIGAIITLIIVLIMSIYNKRLEVWNGYNILWIPLSMILAWPFFWLFALEAKITGKSNWRRKI